MAVEPGSRLYTGARPNALGFKCPRCGSVQTGDVQAGCTACGAGAVAPFRVRPVPMPGDGVEVEIDDQTGEVRALRPPPPPPTRLHTPTTLTEDLTRENFFVTADPVSPLDAIDDSPVETRPTTEYQTRISRESDGRWTVRVTDPITTLTADATDEIIPGGGGADLVAAPGRGGRHHTDDAAACRAKGICATAPRSAAFAGPGGDTVAPPPGLLPMMQPATQPSPAAAPTPAMPQPQSVSQ